MKTAISLLFVVVLWSESAFSDQNEKLRQVTADLRTCIRTYTPEAERAALSTNDAINLFMLKCSPSASSLAPTDVGAIPPGLFRRAAAEEWSALTKDKHNR